MVTPPSLHMPITHMHRSNPPPPHARLYREGDTWGEDISKCLWHMCMFLYRFTSPCSPLPDPEKGASKHTCTLCGWGEALGAVLWPGQ